jgi:hypothetical protein
MFLVLLPSMSERGGSKDDKEFDTEAQLNMFLRQYQGSLARLEIYNAKRVNLKLGVE